jgi:hypothetical protein
MVDPKLLEGRQARCGRCKTLRPSSEALGWFEYKGPGCPAAETTCAHCNYKDVAHDAAEMKAIRSTTVQERGYCTGFAPHGPWEYDSYWCGCGDTD